MLIESQKNELYKSILADVAKIVKDRIEEFSSDSWNDLEELNENVDAATEKKNEQFIENLCKKYKLVYCEGDSVGGERNQLDLLKRAHVLISKRMPVGKINWVTPDNKYFFTFKSWKPVVL